MMFCLTDINLLLEDAYPSACAFHCQTRPFCWSAYAKQLTLMKTTEWTMWQILTTVTSRKLEEVEETKRELLAKRIRVCVSVSDLMWNKIQVSPPLFQSYSFQNSKNMTKLTWPLNSGLQTKLFVFSPMFLFAETLEQANRFWSFQKKICQIKRCWIISQFPLASKINAGAKKNILPDFSWKSTFPRKTGGQTG